MESKNENSTSVYAFCGDFPDWFIFIILVQEPVSKENNNCYTS